MAFCFISDVVSLTIQCLRVSDGLMACCFISDVISVLLERSSRVPNHGGFGSTPPLTSSTTTVVVASPAATSSHSLPSTPPSPALLHPPPLTPQCTYHRLTIQRLRVLDGMPSWWFGFDAESTSTTSACIGMLIT